MVAGPPFSQSCACGLALAAALTALAATAAATAATAVTVATTAVAAGARSLFILKRYVCICWGTLLSLLL